MVFLQALKSRVCHKFDGDVDFLPLTLHFAEVNIQTHSIFLWILGRAVCSLHKIFFRFQEVNMFHLFLQLDFEGCNVKSYRDGVSRPQSLWACHDLVNVIIVPAILVEFADYHGSHTAALALLTQRPLLPIPPHLFRSRRLSKKVLNGHNSF